MKNENNIGDWIDNYLAMSFMDRVMIDNFSDFKKIREDSLTLAQKLSILSVPSTYLWQLNTSQKNILKYDRSLWKSCLSDEMLLTIELIKSEEGNFDGKAFSEIFKRAKNKEDLQYKTSVRKILISLGLISGCKTKVDDCEMSSEIILLQEAHLRNDYEELFKNCMKLISIERDRYTKAEKKVVLDCLKSQYNDKIIEAFAKLCVDESFEYGTWKDHWRSLSNYAFSKDPDLNTILYVKSFMISTDFNDERIDMSMFPNLPTIYDEDEYFEDKYFFDNLDWNRDFRDYELDFILATCLTYPNENKILAFERIADMRGFKLPPMSERKKWNFYR